LEGRKKKLTHEWGETLDLDLFCDDEATATLLAGRFTNHGNGVLGGLVGTKASGGAGRGGIGVVEGGGETVWDGLGWTV
jgi:hypothetical protein